MTYQQALAYLDSLINYEKESGFDYRKSFKLERMKSFSRLFGDPHKGIKAICNKDFGMIVGVTHGKAKTQAQSGQ